MIMALSGMAAGARDIPGVEGQTISKESDTMDKNNVLESIAKGVTDGYLMIENGVVKGYKTMEDGIVKGFTAVTDTITLKLFGKDGETVEEVKSRLNENAEAHAFGNGARENK